MDLTVQQLRYFLAVAEERHFTRAAARLLVSSSALSQQIASLERRLKVSLFRRTSRQVELTPAGAELVPMARRAVLALEQIEAWGSGHGTATLRVGVSLATMTITRILAAAVEGLSGYQVQVERLGFDQELDALRQGRVELVLAPVIDVPGAPEFEAVPLWRERRALLVSSGHRFARRAGLKLEETNGERFLVVGSAENQARWTVIPRADGSVPQRGPVASTMEDVLAFCAAGLGVQIVGESAAGTYSRPDLCFVPIVDTFDVTVCLISRASSSSGPTRAFEEIAIEAVAADAANGMVMLPETTM